MYYSGSMTSKSDVERRIEARARASIALGVAPVDEARTHPDCERYDLCSPYMAQPWAHDRRCQLSGRGPDGIPL